MIETVAPQQGRRPAWLKVKLPTGVNFSETESAIDNHKLHTVCQEALCPNIAECWSKKSATFMILGDTCTRSCGFCAVKTGKPTELDWDEPRRVALAAKELALRYIVVTSVNRDELADGGAAIFAETIRALRREIPECLVEVLIPDFQGDEPALRQVIDAAPDILNHNTETVPRLYRPVRPQGKYDRTMQLLDRAKKAGRVTKSALIVGLGETLDEIKEVMRDWVKVGLDIATIGQYLQPTRDHLPVNRFVAPEEFREFKRLGEAMGIPHVESGPLVRSSYHAGDVHEDLRKVKNRVK